MLFRLDDIFMVLVFLIVSLILAATITTKVSYSAPAYSQPPPIIRWADFSLIQITALVTSAGTFVLGLSWLIGSTLQEILLSSIFLFVKHPYDVGDR